MLVAEMPNVDFSDADTAAAAFMDLAEQYTQAGYVGQFFYILLPYDGTGEVYQLWATSYGH